MPQTTAPPRILIVSANADFAKSWAAEARATGFDPALAVDAGRGLTRAVLSPPEIILFDDDSSNLPAPQFLQILRANPKTAATPFVLVTNDPTPPLSQVGYRDSTLSRSSPPRVAIAHIRDVLARVRRVKSVSGAAIDTVAGTLGQVPLPDLLQLLSSNRRTGVLSIQGQKADGIIAMEDGRLVGARLGEHVREKALFRLLAWKDAPFRFEPEQTPSGIGPTLSGSIASLILEGLRQNDELASVIKELPLDTALRLSGSPLERPHDISTATREVMTLLEFYGTVREAIEHSTATDLDAIRAIEELIDRRAVSVVEQGEAMPRDRRRPLLAVEEVFGLFRWMSQGRTEPPTVLEGKVLLCAESFHPLRAFVHDLAEVEGIELHRDMLVRGARRDGFGTLATAHLADSVWVSLFAIPPQEMLLPLWRFFATGSLAIAVFLEGRGAPQINPLRVVGTDVPVFYVRWLAEEDRSEPAREDGVIHLRESDREGARALLHDLLVKSAT